MKTKAVSTKSSEKRTMKGKEKGMTEVETRDIDLRWDVFVTPVIPVVETPDLLAADPVA